LKASSMIIFVYITNEGWCSIIICNIFNISSGFPQHVNIRCISCRYATCVISAYHRCCFEIESQSGRGLQHYVIKCVSELRQVGGFLRFPPPIKQSQFKIHKFPLWKKFIVQIASHSVWLNLKTSRTWYSLDFLYWQQDKIVSDNIS
jgi:hypothetical protein